MFITPLSHQIKSLFSLFCRFSHRSKPQQLFFGCIAHRLNPILWIR